MFDSFTRSVAKIVSKFFARINLKEKVYSSDEELTKDMYSYFKDNFTIELQNLSIEAKRIESGYSGFVNSSSLKSPLFFEIVPGDEE